MSARPSPTPASERLLAPDLARGMMLLLIALAHSRMLHAGGNSLTTPAGGGPVDVAVQWLLTSFVDGRSAPLFGLLFGYGLVQMTRRLTGPDGDPAGARRLIRRRGAWLVVFGIAHVVLLYAGDVIGAYGAFAVMFAGAVTWPGRRLWVVTAITLAIGALAIALLQMVAGPDTPLAVGPTLLDSAALRAMALPVLPISALSVAPSVLLGVWAGRLRPLEDPGYTPLLRRVALIGFPVAVLGAQPVALQAMGVWTPDSTGIGVLAVVVFGVTGIAGGLAFMAVIALVAGRIGDRRGPVTTALVACGRRSMTFYIAQSPVWLIMTEPSLLDLGGRLGAAAAAAVAVATWVVTVVIADLLGRAGRRGPAETLLRYLTYRDRSRHLGVARS
ncbi:putative membrane protein YeiB [Pseudonocardia autotrophica]|nr:putative membrane protein YeiB [Pseudonocardia autotrophica]